MRVLVQRVLEASVSVGGEEVSRIGKGLLLFVGVEDSDGDQDIEWLAGKVARLRIFDDASEVMNLCQTESNQARLDCRGANRGTKNLDVVETGGEVLAVSQFTLHASTRKGNRPSYIRSAKPEISKPLYERFVARLSRELAGREVAMGIFGADMKVSLVNDGPVTIWMDSKNRE